MQDPILSKNLKLRQALSMAIDRTALTRDILQDGKAPLYSVVTPTVEGGKYAGLTYPWATWSNEKRIAEAKRLYREAGYSAEHPYKTAILYNTNEMYKKISAALAAMWKETLGVQVDIQNQDWKSYLQNRHNGNFQIGRGGWFADYNNVTTYTQLYQCHSLLNDKHWCDPKFDKLVAAGDATTNPVEQHKDYYAALQRAQDAYIIVPLFQFSLNRMVKPYIKGYNPEDNHLDQTQSKWMVFDN